MPRKRTIVCFKSACQNHLKTHDTTNILFNFCQALRALFTCKASEEQEVELDQPIT